MVSRVLTIVATVAFCASTNGAVPGCQETARSDKNLLENPELRWNGDRLSGWTIEKGAGAPRGRTSRIQRASDRSLQLSGDRSTRVWNLVGQMVPVQPGDYLRFAYEAKASDLKLEPRQFDNCYVGLWFYRNRRELARNTYPVASEEYVAEEHLLRVPPGATHAKVFFFLSKSGTLNVKNPVLEGSLDPDDSFDILVRQMDRYYSYFQHKNIDWQALTERYRERATKARSSREFQQVILEMLRELKDGHVWIQEGGRRIPAWKPSWQPNFDFRVVNRDLKDVQRIGRWALVAKTEPNLGYVRITSLEVNQNQMLPLVRAIESKFDTEGMIIDLRSNGGGNEVNGRILASLFCEEPTIYARQKFRLNDEHGEFYEIVRSPVEPRRGSIYQQPVVCLIGPGCVSSGEGTALMFDALPNVTTMGQPTRGSSGNPQPVYLPNGTEVWFSRWVALDADGQPIEDRGVRPDVVVEHDPGDPTWQRAVERLAAESKSDQP